MEVILLVLRGLGWTLDFVLFLLDLNYWLVSSLISCLVSTLYCAFSLPGTVYLGLQHSWECVLLGLTVLRDVCFTHVLGPVQAVGLDNLYLVWNLLCHFLIQSKDTIRQGFLNITLSGHYLHKQVSELLTLANSLVAYSVNTLVNISFFVVHNIISAVLSLWFSLLNVIVTSKKIIVLLLSQLSSTVVAVAILVLAPFQMALEVLVSSSTAIGFIMFTYLYEILFLLFLIWGFYFMLMLSPVLDLFCEKLNRLYHLVLAVPRLMLNCDLWRRVTDQSFQLLRMYTNRSLNQRMQDTSLRMARATNEFTQHNNILDARHENLAGIYSLQNRSFELSTSYRGNEVKKDLWTLLQHQEESRKCVICQDTQKTVLLLPCRHLCLCIQCTQVLLQQPILRRNCPLCRKMILQTLNVYM